MTTLNLDLDQAIGKIHRFWWWCTKYAEDGDLRKHNDDRLARAVGLNGGQEATRFVEAMVASCWIDREPYFRVHDWWDYFGYFLMRKYGDSPDKWKQIKGLYVTVQGTVQEPSPPSLDVPALPTKPTSNTAPPAAPTKRFAKPTPAEVTTYAASIGFKLDGERFCAFYESKGWVIGRAPMKSWKAAVVTWKKDAPVTAMILPPQAKVVEREPTEEERFELLNFMASVKMKSVPK